MKGFRGILAAVASMLGFGAAQKHDERVMSSRGIYGGGYAMGNRRNTYTPPMRAHTSQQKRRRLERSNHR